MLREDAGGGARVVPEVRAGAGRRPLVAERPSRRGAPRRSQGPAEFCLFTSSSAVVRQAKPPKQQGAGDAEEEEEE